MWRCNQLPGKTPADVYIWQFLYREIIKGKEWIWICFLHVQCRWNLYQIKSSVRENLWWQEVLFQCFIFHSYFFAKASNLGWYLQDFKNALVNCWNGPEQDIPKVSLCQRSWTKQFSVLFGGYDLTDLNRPVLYKEKHLCRGWCLSWKTSLFFFIRNKFVWISFLLLFFWKLLKGPSSLDNLSDLISSNSDVHLSLKVQLVFLFCLKK